MKSVLISIRPKWVEKIVNGEKTVEVRKSRPKIETPFKCYIYRTTEKVDEIVEEYDSNFKLLRHKKTLKRFSGKVIGEFVCDKIYEIRNLGSSFMIGNDIALTNRIARESCLEYPDLRTYLKDKKGYGWHISDLKIYDKPKELGEFYKPLKYDEDGVICGTKQEMSNIYEWDCETVFNKKYTECTLKDCPQLQKFYRLNRPPQSWYYVEEL